MKKLTPKQIGRLAEIIEDNQRRFPPTLGNKCKEEETLEMEAWEADFQKAVQIDGFPPYAELVTEHGDLIEWLQMYYSPEPDSEEFTHDANGLA